MECGELRGFKNEKKKECVCSCVCVCMYVEESWVVLLIQFDVSVSSEAYRVRVGHASFEGSVGLAMCCC